MSDELEFGLPERFAPPSLPIRVPDERVLNRAHCAAFRREGYVVVNDFLKPRDVEYIRGIYDELFADEAGTKDGNYCQSQGKDGTRLEIRNCSKYRPELLRTALYTKALALARQLLGRKAEFWGDFAMCKPPGNGGHTPWHQDEAHWSPAYRYNHLAVWVPLQDVSKENGCMSFIPRSHKWGIITHDATHAAGCAKIQTRAVDESLAVLRPMPAGAASVHHCRTLHYAGPNTSNAPRRAYILNFGTPLKYRRFFKRTFSWATPGM